MRGARWLSLLLVVSTLASPPVLAAADHPMIGEAAPEFDLPTLDGGQLASADLRGKFIVLHFGAGW